MTKFTGELGGKPVDEVPGHRWEATGARDRLPPGERSPPASALPYRARVGDDLEAQISLLRARVHDRVERSRKLLSSVRDRTREHQGRALHAFTRAEHQLNRAAAGLPAIYRLPVPDGEGLSEDVLALVLDAARSVFRGCLSTSVTAAFPGAVARENGLVTVAATGLAESLDAAQYRLGEGPLVDAAELQQVGAVHAHDFDDEEVLRTWPRFGEIALRAGICSAVSIALPWSTATPRPVATTVNLYSADTRTLAAPEARGLVLGSWAGAVLTGREPAEVYDAVIRRPTHVPREWQDDEHGGR